MSRQKRLLVFAVAAAIVLLGIGVVIGVLVSRTRPRCPEQIARAIGHPRGEPGAG